MIVEKYPTNQTISIILIDDYLLNSTFYPIIPTNIEFSHLKPHCVRLNKIVTTYQSSGAHIKNGDANGSTTDNKNKQKIPHCGNSSKI